MTLRRSPDRSPSPCVGQRRHLARLGILAALPPYLSSCVVGRNSTRQSCTRTRHSCRCTTTGSASHVSPPFHPLLCLLLPSCFAFCGFLAPGSPFLSCAAFLCDFKPVFDLCSICLLSFLPLFLSSLCLASLRIVLSAWRSRTAFSYHYSSPALLAVHLCNLYVLSLLLSISPLLLLLLSNPAQLRSQPIAVAMKHSSCSK